MKNLFVTILLAMASATANAQLEKDNLMLGGTGGFGFGGGGSGFTGTLSLQPRAGLFLTDRVVVGAGIGLGLSTYRNYYEGRITSYAGSFQPFVRYYFGKAPGKGEVPKSVVPFAEIGAGVSGGFLARGPRFGGASGYGMVGINKFFNEHVALEVNLSYMQQSTSFDNTPFRSRGLSGGIGLQIFLDRGKAKQPKGTDAAR